MSDTEQVVMPAKITAFDKSMVPKLRNIFNEIEYRLTDLYEAQADITSSSDTAIRNAIEGAITGGLRRNRPSI
jgi:hypothetical protein